MSLDLRISAAISDECVNRSTKYIMDELLHVLNEDSCDESSEYFAAKFEGIIAEVIQLFPEISEEDAIRMVIQGTLMVVEYSAQQYMDENNATVQ